MKKRKNLWAKIVAGIALLAIILWIVGTWILFVISSFGISQGWETDISSEDVQQYIENLTGATFISDEDIDISRVLSWALWE